MNHCTVFLRQLSLLLKYSLTNLTNENDKITALTNVSDNGACPACNLFPRRYRHQKL